MGNNTPDTRPERGDFVELERSCSYRHRRGRRCEKRLVLQLDAMGRAQS